MVTTLNDDDDDELSKGTCPMVFTFVPVSSSSRAGATGQESVKDTGLRFGAERARASIDQRLRCAR